ncbi:hypothetical protein BABINDRAFT_16995, partial [Babjeviella inositovora NRRL Y-12698]
LEKRAKKVIDRRTTTTSTTEALQAWRRTIYDTVVELVHPTVVAGVTFSAKPPATTDAMAFWVSLNKDGTPKTIKPKNKGGIIKNSSPGYSTWFQTPMTTTLSFEEVKAHNMLPDEKHVEVSYTPEDETYVLLIPIIRCTPERYFKKGVAKNVVSAPFCTPQQDVQWRTEKTYFLTWYSKFFNTDVTNVRVHLAYITETRSEKGMAKRGIIDHKDADVEDRPMTGIASAFYSSSWVRNQDGIIPIYIDEKWLVNTYSYSKVIIGIQPDDMSDEDFDFHTNSIKVNISKTAKVAKNPKGVLKEENNSGDDVYYIIMALPTVVILAALGMYVFLWMTKGDRDLSHLKKYRGKFQKVGRNKKYDKLPQFE